MQASKQSVEAVKLLRTAVGLQKSGDIAGANRLYDAILAGDPSNADALNLKGVIAHAAGRAAEALILFERAAAAAPGTADFQFNKGLALAALGRDEDALHAYAEATRLNPTHPGARLNAGLLLSKTGRETEAIAAFRDLARISPNDPRGFYNLGVCLEQSLKHAEPADTGEIIEEAEGALLRARTLDPNNPDISYTLANLHSFRGSYEKAIGALEQALKLRPQWSDKFHAEALSTLGTFYQKEERHEQSVATQRRAAALRPDDHIIRFNLAGALQEAGQTAEAEHIYLSLLETNEDFVKPYINLANIYRDQNRYEESLTLLERGLAVSPTLQGYSHTERLLADAGWSVTALMVHSKAASFDLSGLEAQYQHTIVLLHLGRLREGWSSYDLRFDVPSENRMRRPGQPYWTGENLAGKNIIVWSEQGVGDETMYASILPQIIGQANKCLIECSERMAPIFARSFPRATVAPTSAKQIASTGSQDWDLQVCLTSLGRYFRNDFADFPAHRGYLKADVEKTTMLRQEYETRAQGKRIVGIAWKSQRAKLGAKKSAALENLAAILSVPGVFFVNLQYGDCAAEIEAVSTALGVDIYQDPSIDSMVDLDAFFAQVAAMDLVISTSNTTVHVAGAQNIPAWVLLPHGKCLIWYWFLRREDSPWYPSVRLIRARPAEPSEPWELEPARRAGEDLSHWLAAPLVRQGA